MSDVIIPYRFLVRAGTAAAVAALNEIPKSRELVFETDTLKFKLGNGVDHYLDLDYIGGVPPITIAGALLMGLADSAGDVTTIELPPGDDGDVLTIVGGIPTWVAGGTGGSLDGGFKVAGGSVELTAALLAGFTVSDICHVDLNAFTRWRLIVFPAGTLTLDIRVAAPQTAMPLSGSDSIVAAAPPSVVSSNAATSTSLTGWGTSIARGSSVTVAVTLCVGVKAFWLEVEGTRIP